MHRDALTVHASNRPVGHARFAAPIRSNVEAMGTLRFVDALWFVRVGGELSGVLSVLMRG